MARFTLDDFPPLSPEFLALKPDSALTEADLDVIDEAARADAENPERTDEALERGVFGRDVRRLRRDLGMTQEQFSGAYRIQLARLRDIEQGRYSVDGAIAAYVAVIRADPEHARRALDQAAA